MVFNELITYLIIKKQVTDPGFVDVTPFGVQYKVKIIHPNVTGIIYYRELNGKNILVKNRILDNNLLKYNISSKELLDILT